MNSPEGVIACVTKNGQYLGIYESGQHWCLPWTEAQYLITKQHIVFDQPVTSCPTSDNIFVHVRTCFYGFLIMICPQNIDSPFKSID